MVVTTSGADACPTVPGQLHENWPVDDVAGQDLEGVRAIRDDIRARVERRAADVIIRPEDNANPPTGH
ncbi:hypothetical protein GR925_21210 [Streptomyces sp. HUCO-GS316]|uniref:hypothetical protein n=1 Tax=Streptomyces sp. HUCO-GS316 TaxID=2692198 RepID=UPI0013689A17|nr:hypothetical protein [Streptomyces sp. HUCO-GS316]MXM65898.1 hypothetical protein [Streptomyces sp. HUCO-GS316]